MVTTRKRTGLSARLLLALFLASALGVGGASPSASAQALGVISGRVLGDTNLNRLVDTSDAPLAAVEVRLLDATGAPIAVSSTDAQGSYSFTGVTPGVSYLITTVPPFATVPEIVQPGPGAVAAGFNGIFIRGLLAGTTYPENDFLQRQFQVVSPVTPATPNTIMGRVVNDLNGDGTPDADEPGLGGAAVTLVNSAGVVLGSTTSAPTGEFTFAGIPNGDLFLTQSAPAGYAATNAVAGVGGARVDVATVHITTIDGVTLYGGHLFLDHATGAVPTPTPGTGTGSGAPSGPNQIEGFVFSDVNGNHLLDRNDAPLGGTSVSLKDSSGTLLTTTTTDASGRFAFSNLGTAVYLVSKADPAGFTAEDAIPGSGAVKIDESTIRVSMSAGLTSYNGSLFLEQPGSVVPAGPNVITGSVLNDANGNGAADAGETGLANVIVALQDASNQPIAMTVTSVAGTFAFSGLANGTYTLVENDPAGYASTGAIPGPAGQVVDANTIRITTIDGVVTYAGNTFLDVQGSAPTPGADIISGLVVNDVNGNSVPDTGEPPLAGAILTLQNSRGQIVGTATSGTDGSFSFSNLADDAYTLIEQPPTGFAGTVAIPGVGGQTISATVMLITTQPGLTSYPGQIFLNQSGGSTPPPAPNILSLNPAAGGPGATVTITGRAFGTGSLQVLFGTTPATVLSSSSLLNTLVVLVPDLPPGPVMVTLVNSAGTSPAVTYTVTAPAARASLAPLFQPIFSELANQAGVGQVGPTMQVVVAGSLGFAQNQAIGGDFTGATSSLRSLLTRIGRSPEELVSSTAKAALTNQINLLIGQIQAQP
jgi:hypothetical protein